MKKILLVLFLLPTLCFAQPEIINTIACTGTPGYSGDGGPATAARMGQALGVAVDLAGNIYFPDVDNSVIRKVNTAGIITTFAGGGSSTADGIAATSASLDLSAATGAITIDPYGNVIFSETSRVRKVNASTGIITTIAGSSTSGFSGDGGPATAARFTRIHGVYMRLSGELYITDEGSGRIRKVNTAGIVSTIAGSGSAGFTGDGGQATNARLNYPSQVCVDGVGNLYIADCLNDRIRKVDSYGIITTIAGGGSGGDGGPATSAYLSDPGGVCLDNVGNIYIADFHASKVRVINPLGIIRTLAGGGSSGSEGIPATSAALSNIWTIGIDNFSNIYIPEQGGRRIRKVNGIGIPIATGDSFSVSLSSLCAGPSITIIPNHYSSTLHVQTWFGDGASQNDTFSAYSGYSWFNHSYSLSGVYTVKHVLYSGSTPIDTLQHTYNYTLCNAFPINFYYDANGNCTKDTGDVMLAQPLTIEVDSNGVAIDTLSATSGLYYTAYGSVGDVYAFRVISMPPAFHVTCPSTGIIYDTIGVSTLAVVTKNMGFDCTTSSAYDLSIFSAAVRTGVQFHTGNIYATNAYCPPVNATVTLRHSPKHTYHYAAPAPASTTATSVTWNLSALTSVNGAPTHLYYHLETPSSAYLTPGDTVNSNIVITPDSTDADTSNNVIVIVDTVRAGYDPNAIYVKPAGCIASGTLPTQLEYTITFENTGNDTAHNIYVMDTLPDYVDVSTMRIVMASHEMYTSKIKDAAGHNILKFDFPVINLLDSSHHGLCDGAVIYDIKTKPGLAIGTNIMNRVGIYFDVNPVVMTNEAITAIGCPIVNEVAPLSPKGELSLYPNPANDVLNIKQADNSYTSFTITNNIGGVIMSGSLNKTLTQLNIQSLPPGLYFINLKGEQGSVVKKVVKW